MIVGSGNSGKTTLVETLNRLACSEYLAYENADCADATPQVDADVDVVVVCLALHSLPFRGFFAKKPVSVIYVHTFADSHCKFVNVTNNEIHVDCRYQVSVDLLHREILERLFS